MGVFEKGSMERAGASCSGSPEKSPTNHGLRKTVNGGYTSVDPAEAVEANRPTIDAIRESFRRFGNPD